VTRAGMGSCGSKTCNALIHRLFRDEGIPTVEVTDATRRPLFMEVPLGVFAGATNDEGPMTKAASLFIVGDSSQPTEAFHA
jgi:hypothetical protein